MFGHQDDTPQQDGNNIPDHEIDAALSEHHDDNANWGHPGAPLDDNTVVPTNLPAPSSPPVSTDTPASDDQPIDTNALLDLKQKALGQLAPLVSHLDQTPEEKFRTLMMMIQASDDQSKIKEAYAAAQAITDEKGRAQALLDVVNEINYFTQGQEG